MPTATGSASRPSTSAGRTSTSPASSITSSQFRVTPDIVRETGVGSSINGSLTYRLKYGYAQFNMDDWLWRGTYVRFGMIQTPYVDFEETVYRYRFQGTIFVDREGYNSSSDYGVSFRTAFPNNYGEVVAGYLQRRLLHARRPERPEVVPDPRRRSGRSPVRGCSADCA